MKSLLVVAAMLLSACTDATIAQITSIGSPAEVICYSGGKEIYHGKSSGKVSTEEHSDGWYFKDAETGRLIRISADCIILN